MTSKPWDLTPCVNICRLNDSKVCVGCKRTVEQIRDWRKYSDAEKRRIMRQLEEKQ